MRYTKEATSWAEQTLVVDPDNYDAHLAGGFSNTLLAAWRAGALAGAAGWVSGDKQGDPRAETAAGQRGHYLAPFADILLAIAYVRDHDKQHARELLATFTTNSRRIHCSRRRLPGWIKGR